MQSANWSMFRACVCVCVSATLLTPSAAVDAFSWDQLLKSSRNITYNQRVRGTTKNYDEWQRDADSEVPCFSRYRVCSLFRSQHSTAANQTVNCYITARWSGITEHVNKSTSALMTSIIVIFKGFQSIKIITSNLPAKCLTQQIYTIKDD